MKYHNYYTTTVWTGNLGQNTSGYTKYLRDHVSLGQNKNTIIPCSSDPSFRGDPTRYNPEELLVMSLSNCHMLWYLHLCAINAIDIISYEDHAEGEMVEDSDGKGRFAKVTLRPKILLASGDLHLAGNLHHQAHKNCFIAQSVQFPVLCQPEIAYK